MFLKYSFPLFMNKSISGNKLTSNFGSADYWVIKVDATGNKLWEKNFGGTNDDRLYHIIQIDEGYMLAGYSASNISGNKLTDSKGGMDYWLIQIDNDGNKVWEKNFGGNGNDELKAIQLESNNNWALGGWSFSTFSGDKTENNRGFRDYWILKINDEGQVLWDKSFGTIEDDLLSSIQIDNDRGYILGGYSSSNISFDKSENSKGLDDFWVIKYAPVLS